MHKVGLLLIATSKYNQFVDPIIESIKQYFFVNDEVKVFLFTDKPRFDLPVLNIEIQHQTWPRITLNRYRTFTQARHLIEDMVDYLFYSDIDMKFVAPIDSEILPDKDDQVTVVRHPGFYKGGGSWETRVESACFVPPSHRNIYVAGGFNGGTTKSYMLMAHHCRNFINRDKDHGIIPIWQDESALNAYIIMHPYKLLDPSYCYPESWDLPFEKKILALDKNHAELRK